MRFSPLLFDLVPTRTHVVPDAVEARLVAAVEEAQLQWPGVTNEADAFVAWIAPRLPDSGTIEEALDALQLADLYLACACARGDARALAAFDRDFIARDSRTSDDAKQALRQRLFVHEADGRPPRIALYAGRGALGRWVRAALARLAIDEVRATRDVPTEDALIDALGIDPSHDPATAQLKKDTKALLQGAFRDAVSVLPDRDRTMLLQYYIDGVGLAELAKQFGIAPSNVSRGLAKTRLLLVSQVKRALMRDNKIAGDELDSLVNLVRSQLSLADPREPG